ncbi:hypothetical protein EJ03DRAFT_62107 [Teratosphaeria nubilosa]|uniref:Uncharacterized protein n=1 Tax=Teratosphaeria nubilosa TaxID=161662 RepID=A0A6G1LCQ6_9PEZI|nr:hypothetical protein EJ03DRAFT_62107 [Teratosphaeria nubilosa]
MEPTLLVLSLLWHWANCATILPRETTWVPEVTYEDSPLDARPLLQKRQPPRCGAETSRSRVSTVHQDVPINGRATIVSTPRSGRIAIRASEQYDPNHRATFVECEVTNQCNCPVRIEIATPSMDPNTGRQPVGHDLATHTNCEFPSVQVLVGTGILNFAITLLAYYC